MNYLLLLTMLTVLVTVGNMDYKDAVKQQSHYCEMVELFELSNGENGWPDYKGVYDNECKILVQNETSKN